jgi:dienelactone hydrolase
MLLFLLAALPAPADECFPLGQVIDPVISLQDPTQSYALYLPAGYATGRRWPILYGFDPGGRGAVPVALFREAADKFGWIVAASNNSRNGPWKDIYVAAGAVWDDTHARLRIDDSRVYAAGFSGGARVACGLARMLNVQTAGVIGCGAGLPEWLAAADLVGIPWFGTAGFGDFNLREMKELEKELLRLGSPCELKVFPGQHVWPPVGIAMEAVAWMEELYLKSLEGKRQKAKGKSEEKALVGKG